MTTKNSKVSDMAPGSEARVTAVNGSSRVSRRLLEMGVIPGTPVSVVKTGPFGDPIQLRVRGYSLAIRRSDAEAIEVIA